MLLWVCFEEAFLRHKMPEHNACMQDGDLLHLMSIMNKQDYARWHSYEFMLSTRTSDPTLRPPGHPEVSRFKSPFVPMRLHPVFTTAAESAETASTGCCDSGRCVAGHCLPMHGASMRPRLVWCSLRQWSCYLDSSSLLPGWQPTPRWILRKGLSLLGCSPRAPRHVRARVSRRAPGTRWA